MRLFLFDIDGTLVTARGAGRAAMKRAMKAAFGESGTIDQYDFRGKTDPGAIFDILREAGVPDDTIAAGLAECFRLYALELETLLGEGGRVHVMPGVTNLVRALGARDDALVGLLTGNIEAGARIKLRPTGLWPHFRVGAFGSDHADRRRLPAIACDRARLVVGREFPFDRVTIIGDTPLDVDCARACGAVAVAVATGSYAAEELAGCAPDALFSDLSDVDAVLAALVGPRG